MALRARPFASKSGSERCHRQPQPRLRSDDSVSPVTALRHACVPPAATAAAGDGRHLDGCAAFAGGDFTASAAVPDAAAGACFVNTGAEFFVYFSRSLGAAAGEAAGAGFRAGATTFVAAAATGGAIGKPMSMMSASSISSMREITSPATRPDAAPTATGTTAAATAAGAPPAAAASRLTTLNARTCATSHAHTLRRAAGTHFRGTPKYCDASSITFTGDDACTPRVGRCHYDALSTHAPFGVRFFVVVSVPPSARQGSGLHVPHRGRHAPQQTPPSRMQPLLLRAAPRRPPLPPRWQLLWQQQRRQQRQSPSPSRRLRRRPPSATAMPPQSPQTRASRGPRAPQRRLRARHGPPDRPASVKTHCRNRRHAQRPLARACASTWARHPSRTHRPQLQPLPQPGAAAAVPPSVRLPTPRRMQRYAPLARASMRSRRRPSQRRPSLPLAAPATEPQPPPSPQPGRARRPSPRQQAQVVAPGPPRWAS